MTEKVEIYVRFANEGVYYDKINVDPSKINNPRILQEKKIGKKLNNGTKLEKRIKRNFRKK